MMDVGNLFVIAAPSGTGKTTLVKALAAALPQLTISISHTTRAKRSEEIDGVNYHFVSDSTFREMINNNEFLEHAMVFNHQYGTSRAVVEQKLKTGEDVILEIDWQGYQQVKNAFPNAMGIFILPPSFAALRERLEKRAQDNQTIIEKRLADAKIAVSHVHEFEYVIINDDFATSIANLIQIIKAGQFLQRRQKQKIAPILANLSS